MHDGQKLHISCIIIVRSVIIAIINANSFEQPLSPSNTHPNKYVEHG